MKSALKIEELQRDYFQRLLSDQSVEDKMKFFTRAKRIFNLVTDRSGKRRKK